MTREEAIKILQDVRNPRIREAICTLHPELRESEDEKIRKFLIKLVNDGFTHFPDSLTRNGVLTYLEKQKESTWTEEDESFRKHILPRILNPTSWTMEQIEADKKRLEEFVERQKNKWVEKQKEQKPAEPAGKLSREEYLYQLLIDQLITYSDYEYLTGKKPAEWSEEDEKMRVNILNVLTPNLVYSVGKGTHTGTSTYKYDDEIKWLKSLRPQPKQEWSQEEYGRLFDIKHYLDGTLQLSPDRKIACIDFLKSLRPSWQITYRQIVHSIFKMLKGKDFYGMPSSSCVSLLNDIRVKCKDADECAEILAEPSWKPSEEQMNKLFSIVIALRKNHCDDMADFLASIQEQLKKLM